MQSMSKHQQVNRVLLLTFVLNLAVALSKIVLGMVSGALAITADGFHSLADSASNIVALVANTIASQAPDADHPYGHERFETLATLAIGMLLILTVWETLQGVIERLIEGGTPTLSPLAFAVMLATLVINIGVNRYQVAQGRKFDSQLLLADAAHTGADIYVTLSVLLSMGLTVAFGWGWVDLVTAAAVVVVILRAAWSILKRAGSVLVDTAPLLPAQISDVVQAVPSVESVTRARSRGSADAVLVDVDVQVARAITTEQAASITRTIEERLRETFDGIHEVEVHFTPYPSDAIDYGLEVRALADALGLKTHSVRLTQLGHSAVLDLHVEVAQGQSLDEAHRQATRLEDYIRKHFGNLTDVVTHIEPTPADVIQAHLDASNAQLERTRQQIFDTLQSAFTTVDWHHLSVHSSDEGWVILLHAALPAKTSIERAHEIAECAERQLRDTIHPIERVTIHTEPHITINTE